MHYPGRNLMAQAKSSVTIIMSEKKESKGKDVEQDKEGFVHTGNINIQNLLAGCEAPETLRANVVSAPAHPSSPDTPVRERRLAGLLGLLLSSPL